MNDVEKIIRSGPPTIALSKYHMVMGDVADLSISSMENAKWTVPRASPCYMTVYDVITSPPKHKSFSFAATTRHSKEGALFI